MNYDIYCDEAGNTGTNYLDKDQPFYVLSGWFIERNLAYKAKDAVQSLLKNNYPQATELKGSKLLKNNKGISFCYEVIKTLGQHHAFPFFVITEKKYLFAAKMVESFFDPEYNSRINLWFLSDNSFKKQLAELIYYNCDEALEKYLLVSKEPKIELIEDAFLSLEENLNRAGYDQVVYALKGVKENLSAILDEEQTTLNAYKKGAMKTPNLPVFVDFIQMIEKFSRQTKVKKIRMFHDDISQFNEAYPELHKLFSKNKNQDVFTFSDGTKMVFSTPTIDRFKMDNSKVSPLIQGADVYSSLINNILKKLSEGKELIGELENIYDLIVASFIVSTNNHGDDGFCKYIGSKLFSYKLYNCDVGNEYIENMNKINIDPYLK
ncbi:hypothetical protein ABC2843 [Shouchella clausii KSM-K16]|uniref:DUF3800 domain-containing protein n=1 Tax=Shouchella clausii (strain KSM-K16) TaxID=66692 RepID=Q5WE33_SHOC1|nr:DUF3800 domain-containing protein [Shouchella clausii]BAD65377.1 hypothetical protein ABC2843 [Shouchella clausii KSM-K16]